jgi:hypothetical protein
MYWVKAKKVKPVRIGKKLRFPLSEVEKFQ